MIDAYEIGIQLMLQEDVSAGLAVINRGLAEVDRAIAATSADLVGLVREAETATKAVAAAVGGRAALASATGQKTDTPLEQHGHSDPKQGKVLTAATSTAATPTARDTMVAEPVAPAGATVTQPSSGQVGPMANLDESATSSSAPAKAAVGETVTTSRNTDAQRTEPGWTVDVAAAQAVPAASSSPSAQAEPAKAIAAAAQQPRSSVTPPITPVALTASVSREQRSAMAAGRRSERAQHPSSSGQASRRERPVAPWSGVDQAGSHAATVRLHEKATAPQSASRGQAEAAGGTVMLDGRLVGQWLSEHMGREASRPPAGTSFFDPRQTPAWNVSGAI